MAELESREDLTPRILTRCEVRHPAENRLPEVDMTLELLGDPAQIGERDTMSLFAILIDTHIRSVEETLVNLGYSREKAEQTVSVLLAQIIQTRA